MLDLRLFPPDYRGKYPHMFPHDVAVWERFLDKFGGLYEGFYYDIMCGEECKQVPRWEEKYRRDAIILSKLRIDAVGVRGNTLDIIEVKPRGNMAAVGQLLTYMEQYQKEYNPSQSLRAVLVCGEIDPNVLPLAEKNHIVYIVV